MVAAPPSRSVQGARDRQSREEHVGHAAHLPYVCTAVGWQHGPHFRDSTETERAAQCTALHAVAQSFSKDLCWCGPAAGSLTPWHRMSTFILNFIIIF